MLHDLGIQIIVKYFPEEFGEIINLVNSGDTFIDAEEKVLGLTHQEIGKFVANKWSLPKNLCDVIEFHHNPSKSNENINLISIVHLADSMTQEFKIANGFWDGDLSFDLSIMNALEFESVEDLGVFTSEYNEVFKDTATSLEL